MRHTSCQLLGLVVLCLTISVGCKPSNEPTSAVPQSTPPKIVLIEVGGVDATLDYGEYTYEQKPQFISSMETQLVAIKHSLEAFAIRINSSGDEAKAVASPRIEALREQVALLRARIVVAKNSTPSTWLKAKTATDEIYDTLNDEYDAAREWISDQIAP
ncbi:MAG: hypothetical protein ACFCU3_07205 [Verrucomicrobiales bacterium]